jgi:hypothetical protein
MSTSRPDHYAVLQVSEHADPEVIDAAYRALARKWHPDVNGDPGAADHMRAINAAYHVLRDPERRARYDREQARRPVSAPAWQPEPGEPDGDVDHPEPGPRSAPPPPSSPRPARPGAPAAPAMHEPCSLHEEMDAVAECARCGSLLCQACIEFGDCPTCAEEEAARRQLWMGLRAVGALVVGWSIALVVTWGLGKPLESSAPVIAVVGLWIAVTIQGWSVLRDRTGELGNSLILAMLLSPVLAPVIVVVGVRDFWRLHSVRRATRRLAESPVR